MGKQHREKSSKDSKKKQGQKYTLIHSEQHSKNYQIGKRPSLIAYRDTGFKKKFTSIHDTLSKWIDTYKKKK